MSIELKSKEEIEVMREGGAILRKVLEELKSLIKEGMRLNSLDDCARERIKELGAVPAFLGYKPYGAEKAFSKSVCLSLNQVVVHGVPSERVLQKGDVLKIDLGVLYKGFYTDAAITVGVGRVSSRIDSLLQVTETALQKGIAEIAPNKRLGDIGFAIQSYVENMGFKVIRGLTGHGIGHHLHEEPTVENHGKEGKGVILKEGMVLAIEPMTSESTTTVIQDKDDSYITSDKSISAHFEDTVAVTSRGYTILTR